MGDPLSFISGLTTRLLLLPPRGVLTALLPPTGVLIPPWVWDPKVASTRSLSVTVGVNKDMGELDDDDDEDDDGGRRMRE